MRDIILVFTLVVIIASLWIYQKQTSIAVARDRLESTWAMGPVGNEGFVDVISATSERFYELPDPKALELEDGYTGKGFASAKSTSYDLLPGGLPQPRSMEGPSSHACYMSLEKQLPKAGGSYSQCTNHVDPKKTTESCSAPNHDFVNTFYKA
jgi:hypothetical protein